MPPKLESPDAQTVLGIAQLTITVIELPLCVYCAWTLHQIWNEVYMKKRRPVLVLSIFICSVYALFIDYPHFIILKFFPYVSYWDPPHVIVYAFNSFPRWAQLVLLTLRIYLLHYDHEYGRLLKTHKWKILMNENEENWYFLNKLTYGSDTWITKRILLPIFLTSYGFYLIVWFILRYPMDITVSICHALTLLFFIISLTVNIIYAAKYWKQFPTFMDSFHIRDELKLIIAILACSVIVSFVIAPFSLLLFYSSSANITLLILLSVLQLVLIYTLTVYPKRKYVQHASASPTSSFLQHWEEQQMSNSYNTWRKITHTEEGYESWANFLEKEFSIENLMFITEYVMVKELMLSDPKLKELFQDMISLEFDFELPQSLRSKLSSIAKEYKDSGDFMKTAAALVLKYINPRTSTLEINLPFMISKSLIYKFESFKTKEADNDDIKAVIRLLDRAADAICRLMADSFVRFKHTETFENVIKHIEENRKNKGTEMKRVQSEQTNMCTSLQINATHATSHTVF